MSGADGVSSSRTDEEDHVTEGDCPRHSTAPIQTAHVVHGRTPGRTLQFSVSAVGHEPRITVTSEDPAGVTAGGFVALRDVRRVARALAGGGAQTYVALRPWGALPGGRVRVDQDGEDAYLVAVPPSGASVLFGPVPVKTLAAVCRDVVGWSRLLAATA